MNCQSEMPIFVCDTLLITNTLINLIENAIQASQAGQQIMLDIRFDESSNMFCLEITDRGKV